MMQNAEEITSKIMALPVINKQRTAIGSEEKDSHRESNCVWKRIHAGSLKLQNSDREDRGLLYLFLRIEKSIGPKSSRKSQDSLLPEP